MNAAGLTKLNKTAGISGWACPIESLFRPCVDGCPYNFWIFFLKYCCTHKAMCPLITRNHINKLAYVYDKPLGFSVQITISCIFLFSSGGHKDFLLSFHCNAATKWRWQHGDGMQRRRSNWAGSWMSWIQFNFPSRKLPSLCVRSANRSVHKHSQPYTLTVSCYRVSVGSS